jgi:tetratricopeptide (TPR) repeat protein
MKSVILSFFLILSAIMCQAQDTKNIEYIFNRMSLHGVDTKQPLLYGYFFIGTQKANLEKLKKEVVSQGYKVVRLEKIENDSSYILHIEKIESHSVASLKKREKDLKDLAKKHAVESYDGWDVGNTDPTKPVTSEKEFRAFIEKKKNEELYDLGTKLYDIESFKYALIVFDECVLKNIKLDTSNFKLGICLIELKQVDMGIAQLEKAIVLNPKYFKAYFNLGSVYYDTGKFDKSIACYEKATLLNDKDSRSFYGIAASQYVLGNFKDSKKNCEIALTLDPLNENALILKNMLKGK